MKETTRNHRGHRPACAKALAGRSVFSVVKFFPEPKKLKGGVMFVRKVFVIVMLLIAVSVSAEVINVSLSTGQLTFINGYPTFKGFNKLQIPGTPILPANSNLFALPPGSRIASIDVQYCSPQVFENLQFKTAPPSLPLSSDEVVWKSAVERWQKNHDFLLTSREIFPLKPVYYSKMSRFRNIPFIKITYFPFLYSNDKVYYYPSCFVTIHYVKGATDNSIPDWVSKNAAKIFSNWKSMKNYYRLYSRADSFDYVVLTNDSLFSAFDSLVNWKNSIGYHTKLVSIDSVVAQYPGNDTPDKIRNFLIDKYLPWGIHYVLIGGNIDMIPMKMCYPDSEHSFDTPTDYYYAELTDDWDSDNDGYYGEYGQDSIGFVPEVIVGRFPYNDINRLRSVSEKTVNFEKDTGGWKKNALLLGAFSNFENEDSTGWPSCDGAVLMETIKDSLLSGWTYTRMYEEAGLCPSGYPHEYALTEGNVVSVWSGGNYSIVPWFGHGGPGGAYRKWWAYDDGDSIPEADEMSWAPFIYITDVPNLDNTHPSIIFAASCSNAEGDSNIARSLIGNGASGIVAATRYGWYTPGWSKPSDGDLASLNYYFYYYLISQNERVGDALFDCKVYYFNNLYFPDPWAGDPDWSPQQNLLDYTLFGDPSLVREGVGVYEKTTRKDVVLKFSIIPNLIHSQGQIKYSIPTECDVNISLYNVVGQKIGTLYKAREKAGFHKMLFNNTNFSKGVYFIKMQLNGENKKITMVEKIILF